ncbi:Myb-like protein L [Choanephora cucurbitarum]|uniref:Myb-like protein L n=2 Tax=Choanephora cucurbitarum TaxID=101091 RepID=A0A1C7NBM2_9FUNG|nr:Myb-like protein L [Choanephora cucurbitarum]
MLLISRFQLPQAFKFSFQHKGIVSPIGLLQTSFRSLSTATQKVNKVNEIEELRRKAFEVQKSAAVRSRCPWTKEESEKLLRLVNVYGQRWTLISSKFVNRSPTAVLNRYTLLKDQLERGPWSKKELDKLRLLGRGRTFQEIDDWDTIQAGLPHHRPIFIIKQKYKNALDPQHKHGRWSEDETERLVDLIQRFGQNDMAMIADLLGTRNERQCFEKWNWQLSNAKKGRFTPEEDALIIEAIKKYGENFGVIQKITGIPRTPRHISQHYHNMLHPNVDRSPWTREEEEEVYRICRKNNRDMQKTKEDLASKRSVRDMWNHFYKIERSRTNK